VSRRGDPCVRAVDVVVSFLERDLTAPAPAPAHPDLELRRESAELAPAMAAAMYRAVGAPWHWVDRLPWTEANWRDAIDTPDTELWIASVGGIDAGYFELHANAAAVELKYFGLRAEFIGHKLGGPLLDAAITRATALGRTRMTVNTCTLDHPAALRMYQRHGFQVVRVEHQRRTVDS
jgi:GNAT superfamily N-acetyltransferase